ncbi:MAG: phosphatidylglycerophosphatase A [Acidobacteria bacterium]|nr:phosphatidylglycerophosphatase A [Acidobacteriota bacterium]MCB9398151.1 phosphatidylglycerophosphatase A [Acidobacteriota bacterium]
MFRVLMYGLATGLWSGYAPKAPGTVTSALTVVAVYFLLPHSTGWPLLLAFLVSSGLGVWSSTYVEQHSARHDPGFITIDEVAGQLLTFAFVPLDWRVALAGFCLFRVFDIWKPGLIRKAGHLKAGWGVMADDWLAGLCACAVLHGLVWILWK